MNAVLLLFLCFYMKSYCGDRRFFFSLTVSIPSSFRVFIAPAALPPHPPRPFVTTGKHKNLCTTSRVPQSVRFFCLWPSLIMPPSLDPKMNVFGLQIQFAHAFRPETGDFSDFHFRISFSGLMPPSLDPKMKFFGLQIQFAHSFRPETGEFSGSHFRISFSGRPPPGNGGPVSDRPQ